MDLDSWVGRKIYNIKRAQAKRFAERAAAAQMDGDVERGAELRERYSQLIDEANAALDHPWSFVVAHIVIVLFGALLFVLAIYLGSR